MDASNSSLIKLSKAGATSLQSIATHHICTGKWFAHTWSCVCIFRFTFPADCLKAVNIEYFYCFCTNCIHFIKTSRNSPTRKIETKAECLLLFTFFSSVLKEIFKKNKNLSHIFLNMKSYALWRTTKEGFSFRNCYTKNESMKEAVQWRSYIL